MSKLYERKVNVPGRKPYSFRIEEYNSAAEMANDSKRRTITDTCFHEPEYSTWSGIASHEEALDLLSHGYKPAVERLRSKVNLTMRGNSKRMAFRNNVTGFAPVVPLALMGVPNSMIDSTTKQVKSKVVDVYYDMTCPASTSSEQVMKNGEKLLGAIMELELQGYKFNLYAVQGYAGNDSCDMLIVKIKSSNQPFDLLRMSFPLMHTGFFRVMGFDWYSKTPNGKYRAGYGHTLSFEFKEKLDSVVKQLRPNAVWFSGNNIKDSGEEYIKTALTGSK